MANHIDDYAQALYTIVDLYPDELPCKGTFVVDDNDNTALTLTKSVLNRFDANKLATVNIDDSWRELFDVTSCHFPL